MPRGDRYVSSLFSAKANKTTVRSRVFSRLEAATLTTALNADAGDLYYLAWITFLDALRGADQGFQTWSAVKLYYTLFYALRALLSKRGFCAFYVDDSYYTVQAHPNASPISSKFRGDHKNVLGTFVDTSPTHILLSQNIALQAPLQWFMHTRERANYRRERFGEPTCGPEFAKLEEIGVRRALAAYLSDHNDTYTFDPDHAIVAFPLRALRLIGDELAQAKLVVCTNEEASFLHRKASDRAGGLIAVMRTTGLDI